MKTPVNNSTCFNSRLLLRMHQGFKVTEQNEKLPYVVLIKAPKKINHLFHFLLSCHTVGLWVMVWIYQSYQSCKNKEILIAIDEDGNVFEEKCLSK